MLLTQKGKHTIPLWHISQPPDTCDLFSILHEPFLLISSNSCINRQVTGVDTSWFLTVILFFALYTNYILCTEY